MGTETEATPPPFESFSKIPRLSRDIIVTEKIDGTNAQILITEDGGFFTGSRNRWITPDDDNYGFSRWAHEHQEALMSILGIGRHFGEWWGSGIQRGYNQQNKRFTLFNTDRWGDILPAAGSMTINGIVDVVPTLYKGPFSESAISLALENLRANGSKVAPEFMDPEGVVIFHVAANQLFKKTIKDDASPKEVVNRGMAVAA